MNKKKYIYLTKNFLEGTFKNQINSIFKDREEKPEKLVEFREAIRNGDCKIILGDLTKHQLLKIIELDLFKLLNFLD